MQIFWKRGRNPVRIHSAIIEPFRLKKDLMARFVSKANNFVFNRWAVAGTAARNRPRVNCCPMEVISNEVVSSRCCPRDMTERLRRMYFRRQGGQVAGFRIAPLPFQHLIVDCSAVQTRGSSRFQTAQAQPETTKLLRQLCAGGFSIPACRDPGLAQMDRTVQKCPCRDDYRSASYAASSRQSDALNRVLTLGAARRIRLPGASNWRCSQAPSAPPFDRVSGLPVPGGPALRDPCVCSRADIGLQLDLRIFPSGHRARRFPSQGDLCPGLQTQDCTTWLRRRFESVSPTRSARPFGLQSRRLQHRHAPRRQRSRRMKFEIAFRPHHTARFT